MKTYFTSDTHFDDEYAIQYFNRPFQSVDEMNAIMLEKWNSIITDHDTVYHLGDFTLEGMDHFTKWASQLNGNIKILPGSHDQPWLKDFSASEKVQVIVLCHYSMQVWDRSNHGSWHLFGHSHGKLKGIGLSFDVGVDCTDFMPLSLDMVASKIVSLKHQG